MCYYLLDYENVFPRKLNNVQGFTKADKMVIFYSEKTYSVSRQFITDLINNDVDVEFIKANNGTKNDLDFQLSSYVGFLAACDELDIRIVSNDHGYDGLVKFWNARGCHIKRNGCNVTTLTNGQKKRDRILFSSAVKNGRIDKSLFTELDRQLKPEYEIPIQFLRLLEKYGDVDELMDLFTSSRSKTELNGKLMKTMHDGSMASLFTKVIEPLIG